ncbi:hypothetical protein WJX81_002154 [Elliptochloris bilobata]|uniref:Phosphoglycerate mutase n=1 Tax=Elliptochloris bilobata TaxID=381761 RepID=A0AAW1S522_9CHLO
MPIATGNRVAAVAEAPPPVDEIDPEWVKTTARPFDPPLTEKGEEQARSVAEQLKKYDIQQVYISPFYRCIQTARLCTEGLKIPPERWTVSVAVCEFLNPMILVKKGGKLPAGHIQSWFWERGNLKDSLSLKLPPHIASKVKVGQTEFKRYPENLLNSRVRYGRAFQDIADEAQGNVLIVTHGDAVNSSVSRLRPWAIVHPVHHTGFTAAYRDEKEDGGWGPWHLESKSGENGVWWYEQLRPAFSLYHGAKGVVSAACRLVPFRQHVHSEPVCEPIAKK